MPPLLCASSFILDQSFPRDGEELRLVSIALGELERVVHNNEAHLILTDTLREIVKKFDWQRTEWDPKLIDIYNLLSRWFLQPHERLVEIDVCTEDDYRPHPIPHRREDGDLSEIWADEIGRLLARHDACCSFNAFFLGIACAFAFAGGELGNYNNPDNQRVFPLVGPNDICHDLIDAYTWDVPHDINNKSVCFKDALKNCRAIGATEVKFPTGGSHYSVKFEGAPRPWQLDPNVDPVPNRFLRQLVDISGYPIGVIKYGLLYGELPKRVIRFELH